MNFHSPFSPLFLSNYCLILFLGKELIRRLSPPCAFSILDWKKNSECFVINCCLTFHQTLQTKQLRGNKSFPVSSDFQGNFHRLARRMSAHICETSARDEDETPGTIEPSRNRAGNSKTGQEADRKQSLSLCHRKVALVKITIKVTQDHPTLHFNDGNKPR